MGDAWLSVTGAQTVAGTFSGAFPSSPGRTSPRLTPCGHESRVPTSGDPDPQGARGRAGVHAHEHSQGIGSLGQAPVGVSAGATGDRR